jgi:hypothetical protein
VNRRPIGLGEASVALLLADRGEELLLQRGVGRKTARSASISLVVASTISTSNFTRTTAAVRHVTHRVLQSRARGAVPPTIGGSDQGKRKKLLWEIERKLAEDGARRSSFTIVSRTAGSHR